VGLEDEQVNQYLEGEGLGSGVERRGRVNYGMKKITREFVSSSG